MAAKPRWLRVVAPELLPHPMRQADGVTRQLFPPGATTPGARRSPGPVGSSRRRQCGSVRSGEASTRASRRSSFASAGERRSRKRSSCFGLIE